MPFSPGQQNTVLYTGEKEATSRASLLGLWQERARSSILVLRFEIQMTPGIARSWSWKSVAHGWGLHSLPRTLRRSASLRSTKTSSAWKIKQATPETQVRTPDLTQPHNFVDPDSRISLLLLLQRVGLFSPEKGHSLQYHQPADLRKPS